MYQILVPFIIRTVMIHFMGVQYLGLNSLFVSVLQVLSLAELGVGSAMIYSMYKPIAEKDTVTICALMRLYRKYYRIIGLVIAVLGLCIMPFLSKIIKSDVPEGINIYILYLMNLGAVVLSYWLFAYKNSLIYAHQRSDITSKITMIINTAQYAIQIAAIIIFKDYYLYLIISLICTAILNIFTAIKSNKMYPQYKPAGKLPKEKVAEINKRVRDLFTSKIGMVIVNSVDTIVISAFLGLTMLAIYQNYYYILTSVMGFVIIIFNSCTAGIGNSIITETKEKNFNDLKKFTLIIAWIAGFCSCSLLCLYQPFMKLWVGEKLQLDFSVVICLCIYFFVYEINTLFTTYKDAAGIWHEDRFRPFFTAITNLLLNLIMVNFFGIYGVILSTVLSTVIVGIPWLLHNLFTLLFDTKYLWGYLCKIVMYFLVTVIASAITYFLCSLINLSDFLTLIIRGIVCLIVPNILFFIVYFRSDEFKQCVILFNRLTKGKLHLENIIK